MREHTHEANSRDFGIDDHPKYHKVRSGSTGIPNEHEQSATLRVSVDPGPAYLKHESRLISEQCYYRIITVWGRG